MKQLSLALAMISLTACGGGGGGGSISTGGDTGSSSAAEESCRDLTRTEATPGAQWTGSVFTIVMENKGKSEIWGNPKAPYLNQLASQGARAMSYRDAMIHPSEPNYIWMTTGLAYGVADDADPISHPLESTSHIADQLELADLDWRSYQESMGAPCGLKSHGRYAAKHNPFVYFNDITGWDGKVFGPSPRCTEHVVDYSELDSDLANHKVPKYAFITPNLDNDMHDGSIAQGDAWLANEVPKILASDAYRNNGVLFILWDEGSDGNERDEPPFLVMSPLAKAGYVSNTSYDTTSYLKTVENIVGVESLPCNNNPDSVQSMSDMFTVALPST